MTEIPDGYYACPTCQGRGYLISADYLNTVRAAAGVTVETAAEFAGVVRSVIDSMLAGYTRITRDRELMVLQAIQAAVADGRVSQHARVHSPRRKRAQI